MKSLQESRDDDPMSISEETWRAEVIEATDRLLSVTQVNINWRGVIESVASEVNLSRARVNRILADYLVLTATGHLEKANQVSAKTILKHG